MKVKTSALICLVICILIAVPLAISSTSAQITEVNADLAAAPYDVAPVTDGGDSEPQGLPIDTPGGPT